MLTLERFKSELEWQRQVKGEAPKENGLKEDVLRGTGSLKVFGWMRKGSPYVQKMHSIAAFHEVGGPPELARQTLGMIGDRRLSGLMPHPVTLPAQNAWKWMAVPNICMHIIAAGGFFNQRNGIK